MYNEAIQDYSNAIELDPKNSSYLNNRGDVLYNLKRYEEAIQDYSKAIELDPKNGLYYYNRGMAVNNLGKN